MLVMKTSAPQCRFSTPAFWRRFGSAALFLIAASLAAPVTADDKPTAPKEATKAATGQPIPLNKAGTVLLDKAGNRVLLKAEVCLREGALELLCCKKRTKEHEAIFSLDSQAYVVHTALLALGAKPGSPARFDPKFVPASGQKIEIFISWTDDKGKVQRVRAQEWVRYITQKFFVVKMEKLPAGLVLPKPSELRHDTTTQELSWYGKMREDQRDGFLALTKDPAFRAAIQKFYDDSQGRPMVGDWIFVGSSFYKDPETGKNLYLAEDGDLICVANFSNAVLDVNLKSSSSNETLLFEANTPRIPARGTTVTLELVPVPAEKAAPAK
jgi:hypothetical protein